MQYIQHFFLSGQHFGSAARSPVLRRVGVFAPTSDLYFCTLCGQVYATCPCDPPTHWQSYAGICSRHPYQNSMQIPGSIWRDGDQEFLAALPHAVLRHELTVHLTHTQELAT